MRTLFQNAVGRFFEVIGKLAFVGMPGLYAYLGYELIVTRCIQFRSTRTCLADEPFAFWFFTGVLGIAATIYIFVALIVMAEFADSLKAHRNRRAQRAEEMEVE